MSIRIFELLFLNARKYQKSVKMVQKRLLSRLIQNWLQGIFKTWLIASSNTTEHYCKV